ncbi:CCA tRNA nucleotidyltransferase [Chloroflexota bacterium]
MKLYLEPKAGSLLTGVNNLLAERGVKAYLVGGFVRDRLLERETADIDIAVAADALEVAPVVAAALGGRYVPLDEINRIGRVVLAGEAGRWEFDFSSFEESIEQDLARRDFTIDALAIEFAQVTGDFQLIDPCGGLADLRRGIVRTVAETPFAADAVRLLRAVRLAAELGFSIDGPTESQIRNYAHLLPAVAGERIREELLRLLAVPEAGRFLTYLDELDLLMTLIPEMAPTRGVTQPKEHFWNVLEHSIETVKTTGFLLRQGSCQYAGDDVLTATPWSETLARHFELGVSRGSTRGSLLKLAALLHDVAKPQTKAAQPDGRVRFLGHATEGADIVVRILERLRFSNREVGLVEAAVRHHLRPTQLSQEGLPSSRAIYRYFRDTGEAGIDILYLSLADHLATRGPRLDLAHWQEHARMVEYVISQRFQERNITAPPKLVDGHDLIDIFHLIPGPRIGRLLESVREAQASGELTNREEALARLRRQLVTEARR